jgi:excisionase family DNA binding protein
MWDENDLGRRKLLRSLGWAFMNDQHATNTDLPANRPMMTLNEVADYLRIHKITIYSAIKAGGNLGQLKIGRVWRFSRESIVRFADGEEA